MQLFDSPNVYICVK